MVDRIQTEWGSIPADWKLLEVDAIKSAEKRSLAMGPFGSNIKSDNYKKYGVPIIQGTNLYDNFVSGQFKFLSEEKADELASSACFPYDIVFTHRGTIGQVSMIPAKEYPRYIVSQSGMKLTVDKMVADPLFVLYFFKSRFGQYEILKNESQVGVPAISTPLQSLKRCLVPIPPLTEQETIAEVLSSLDDKIDLLKRQNKTLEGMAEALFRQWFIEEAQDEWEEVELQDIYKIKIGRTPPRKESEWFEDIESSQNWPWFSIKDMADCGTFISDSSEFITSEGQENFKIPIIPPRTVVLSFKLTVGRVAITKRPMLSNEAIAHFIPSTTAPSDLVLFCFLKSLNYQSLGSTSSIAQAVNSGTIRKIQMPKFPQSLINRFDVLCSQWFDKINYNQEQLKVLENKRSTLLPKLMSGEVRVQMD